MGGSGGGYFRSSPQELNRKVEQAASEAENAEFETKLASLLDDVLREHNDRDAEAVRRHLDEIKKKIESEIEGTIDLLLGGSVAKHTYVDGLSDIDSLIVLNGSVLENATPSEVLKTVGDLLKGRFPNTTISVGKMCVTVSFNDSEIQLLPAIRSGGDELRITNDRGSGWISVNSSRFAKELTDVNQACGGKVVPVVKLVKGMVAGLPENCRLSGYHVEALAAEFFGKYSGALTTSRMLRDFTRQIVDRVLSPVKDTTGQSRNVDDYLGKENSLERQITSNGLDRISRKIRNADQSASIETWKSLLGI